MKFNKIIAKTITWRIIASSTTFSTAYIVSGTVKSASLITIADTISKTLFYYGHEKIWDNKK
tara:strand:+ start:915 stop:1100 length:186 start_codon:yes stop_codon:yes gene_type:complete